MAITSGSIPLRRSAAGRCRATSSDGARPTCTCPSSGLLRRCWRWACWRSFSARAAGRTDLLLFGGTASRLLSARHIPLFALAAAPIVCRYLEASLAGTRLRGLVKPSPAAKTARALALLNVLLLIVALGAGLFWIAARIAENDEAIEDNFPVAAVDYLVSAGLEGARGYNSYEWGGYLIWRGSRSISTDAPTSMAMRSCTLSPGIRRAQRLAGAARRFRGAVRSDAGRQPAGDRAGEKAASGSVRIKTASPWSTSGWSDR